LGMGASMPKIVVVCIIRPTWLCEGTMGRCDLVNLPADLTLNYSVKAEYSRSEANN